MYAIFIYRIDCTGVTLLKVLDLEHWRLKLQFVKIGHGHMTNNKYIIFIEFINHDQFIILSDSMHGTF